MPTIQEGKIKMNTKLTQDDFLDGKLKIFQPQKGFRAGSDSVLLAASIPSSIKGKILDVGCGVGTASLCYAFRNQNVKIDGIELHQEMMDLADKNIKENGFQKQITVHQSDIFNKPESIEPNSYDLVLTNPPYFKEKGTIKDESRISARIKRNFSIENWIEYCLKMLKPRGYIHLIYPTSDLDHVISCLTNKCGEITIYPLWPKPGIDSKRMIVIARKSVKTPSRLLSGMILHDSKGDYTSKALSALKLGKGLFD